MLEPTTLVRYRLSCRTAGMNAFSSFCSVLLVSCVLVRDIGAILVAVRGIIKGVSIGFKATLSTTSSSFRSVFFTSSVFIGNVRGKIVPERRIVKSTSVSFRATLSTTSSSFRSVFFTSCVLIRNVRGKIVPERSFAFLNGCSSSHSQNACTLQFPFHRFRRWHHRYSNRFQSCAQARLRNRSCTFLRNRRLIRYTP